MRTEGRARDQLVDESALGMTDLGMTDLAPK
jgi:hypothetical protein